MTIREDVTSAVYGQKKPFELTDKGLIPVHKSKKDHWGWHLILDCADCNENIDDEDQIKEFIDTLVEELGMKKLSEITLVRVDSEEEGRGISATVIISTSTITCHFDDQGYCAYIDIFSCKTFEPKTAINTVEDFFDPKTIGDVFLFRDAGKFAENK